MAQSVHVTFGLLISTVIILALDFLDVSCFNLSATGQCRPQPVILRTVGLYWTFFVGFSIVLLHQTDCLAGPWKLRLAVGAVGSAVLLLLRRRQPDLQEVVDRLDKSYYGNAAMQVLTAIYGVVVYEISSQAVISCFGFLKYSWWVLCLACQWRELL